ncbi:MAG: hypothetical protein ABMB14_07090 [Myxococcota bacterium]
MITTLVWALGGCADRAPEPAVDPVDPVDPVDESDGQEPGGDGTSVEEDPPGTVVPAVALEPAEVFPGRTVELVVRGTGTAWTDGVAVDLGPDLMASDVTVASPTEVHATVIVPDDAAFGPLDVTVGQGTDALVASLEVVPSLSFSQLYGTTAQGSKLFIIVDNLDTTPFDLSHDYVDDGTGTYADVYTDLRIVTPDGIVTWYGPGSGDDPHTLGLVFALDVDAPVGPLEVQVVSGTQHTLFRSEAIEIAARAPVPLVEGEVAEATLPALGDSLTFSFGAERSIFSLDALPVGNSDEPWITLLGPSGSFAEPTVAFGPQAAAMSDGPVYAVVSDGYGFSTNLDFTIVGRSAPLGTAVVAEAEPNDAIDTAQAVALPITVEGGALEVRPDGAFGEDWYRVEIGPEDADRSLAISTTGPSEEATDTRVRILDAAGAVLLDQDNPNLSFSYHETVFAPPLGAGTFYVVVSSDQAPYPWAATYSVGLALAAP